MPKKSQDLGFEHFLSCISLKTGSLRGKKEGEERRRQLRASTYKILTNNLN